MATVRITVEAPATLAMATRVIAEGRNPEKAMRLLALSMEQETRQRFRDQADPWGNAWIPHSPNTIARRVRSGPNVNRQAGRQILIDSGDMFASIKRESDASTASVSMGEGLPDPRAEVHQFGTTTAGRGNRTTIPARPVFPVDESGAAPPDRWWDAVLRPIAPRLRELIGPSA